MSDVAQRLTELRKTLYEHGVRYYVEDAPPFRMQNTIA